MANWRWHLRLWDAAERQRFWETMMLAWSKRQDREPAMRSIYFTPYSPNVVPFTVSELMEMAKEKMDWRKFIATSEQNFKEIKHETNHSFDERCAAMGGDVVVNGDNAEREHHNELYRSHSWSGSRGVPRKRLDQ